MRRNFFRVLKRADYRLRQLKNQKESCLLIAQRKDGEDCFRFLSGLTIAVLPGGGTAIIGRSLAPATPCNNL